MTLRGEWDREKMKSWRAFVKFRDQLRYKPDRGGKEEVLTTLARGISCAYATCASEAGGTVLRWGTMLGGDAARVKRKGDKCGQTWDRLIHLNIDGFTVGVNIWAGQPSLLNEAFSEDYAERMDSSLTASRNCSLFVSVWTSHGLYSQYRRGALWGHG